jgi:hypothetical protein
VLLALNHQVREASVNWTNGTYLTDDPNRTQRINTEVLARVDTLKGVINMSYEDYKECFNHE